MKNIVLTYLFLLISFSTTSQELDLNYYIPSNQNYNDKIPTPKEIIGHQIGEWHITHDKLVEYMKILAKSSDRITLEDRGKTFEGRPLLLIYNNLPCSP